MKSHVNHDIPYETANAISLAMTRKELKKECFKIQAEVEANHNKELDAIILWNLHEQLGLGKDRLYKFYTNFIKEYEALIERYQMYDDGDDVWIHSEMLKRIGVDIDAWQKEVLGK